MEKQILPGLKWTFLAHVIVGLIFGLANLLLPVEVWKLFGITVQEPAIYRLIGGAVLGFAASSWFAWRETAWGRVKIVVQAEMVWPLLGALVSLWAVLVAGLPAAWWLNVVVLGGFAGAFWYFYFKQ